MRSNNSRPLPRLVKPKAEEERIAREVSGILNFFEESSPDFITDAVIDAIDEACERLGIEAPTYDANRKTGNAQTGNILTKLFAQTRSLKLRPEEGIAADKQRVIDATAEILHNPQTPSDLFQSVSEFVTDATNRDAEQVMHSAPVLTAIMGFYPENELMGAVIAARKEGQS